MNRLEAVIYNIVRKNPAIKQLVRNTYQTFFDLMPRKKDFFSGDFDYVEDCFFGFHDICPFSSDDTKILAHRTTFDLRMPNRNESVDIGYFDLLDGKFGKWHHLGQSYAWNWHKGARLQWIDDFNVIFNSAVNGEAMSKIVNISSLKETIVPYPIDAVYSSGTETVATSFSYERLQRCMPGYGYLYNDESYLDDDIPENTGLYELDLKTNTRRLIVTMSDLAKEVNLINDQGYLHFVTHSEFSPDGRYISFLYRRIPKSGNYMKRWTNIIVYDRLTSKIHVLPSQDSGSHYVWNTKNQLIASCYIDGKNVHVLFTIKDGVESKIISEYKLNFDGHQSFIDDLSFVTDCYPDRHRMAKIFKVDIRTNRLEKLVSVFSPKKFQTKDFKCHIACDLHPRVSRSGHYLSFDSPRLGKRGLYIMHI